MRPCPSRAAATTLVALLSGTVGWAGPISGQNQRTSMLSKAFDVGPGGSLVVDIGEANVEIESGGTSVEIEVFADGENLEWAQELFRRMEFDVSERSNTVRIDARVPEVGRLDRVRHRGSTFVTAVIRIPRRFDLDLTTTDGSVRLGVVEGAVRISTGDGSVDIDGVGSTADVRIQTGDGDVLIQEATASTLTIETGDGDITAGDLMGERVMIESKDGNISVSSVSGEVSARTEDGDVRLRLTGFVGAEIVSAGGDIAVRIPANLTADIEISGEDLELDGEFSFTGRQSRNEISGTVNGGGPELRAVARDGRVTLTTRS